MSTDSDAGADGEMEKINVRVPQALLAEIDEVWEQRGYANKSEFIRDALRDDGETVSQADVKERLGIDD
ncbi:ribbon-helix-helix domain-containing protein [Halovenus halobia]|uniref:ribbon-helix-helix domain-containing protein n=1 Tax=Halovenus halobia TaxID=3396622 RepID=UPI003F5722CF